MVVKKQHLSRSEYSEVCTLARMDYKKPTFLKKVPWDFILKMSPETLEWKIGEKRFYQATGKE